MVYNKIYAQLGEERHIVLDPINYQYDIKQILVISGETVPDYYEADVCNVGDTATLTMVGTEADGVEIPDKFLLDGRNVLIYVVIPGNGGDVQTRYDITIPVDERAEREDIDPSEAEQQQIDSLINALNSGVERAEAAATAAEESATDAEGSAGESEDQAENAEAWAVGQRAGTDVGTEDPTYHNNSKYYAGRAEEAAAEAGQHEASWETWVRRAENAADDAEGSARAAAGSKADAEAAAQTANQKAAAAASSATEAENSASEAAQTVAGGVGAINTARDGALTAIGRAGTTQTGAVNQAGADQVAAVNQAGATQAQAVEDKGDEVLDSIPQDYSDLVDDVADLTRQFDEFSNLRYDADANLFNIATIIPNKYVNQSNGQLSDNSSYTASDFIDVSAYDYVLLSRKTLSGFAVRWCTYSENKNYITGEIYDSNLIFSDIYFGESTAYYRIDTHNASYFRFSATNVFFDSTKNPAVIAGFYPREVLSYENSRYVISETAQDQRALAAFTESAGGFYYNAWTNIGFYSGRSVDLGITQALKGNERITAFCKITTMGELSIGFAGNSYKFHIDDTNYWWTANGIDGGTHFAHNMTIRDYLAIMMELAEDGATCNIRVETNGGEWTRTNSSFTSGRGKVNITSNGFVGEINIVWMPKISKPIWVFGDSYISNYAATRWGYYLIQWGLSSQVLMDGYPGAPAQDAIVDFENLLTMGTPKYAVWAMGMNNADSGAINSDWKTATEKFIADCEKYNITPILATIPNTPNNNNTYKNAWVKSSGYRYVDFAMAVNAESANATWYDGMLSNDNTHPDVQGAICLATAFIDFVPEVTFK